MIRVVPFTESDVFAADEVVVRAWSNGAADGVPVLICNGLGAPAQVWPGLYDGADSGLRVVGFNHRGTGGSGRPLDESATMVSDYAADAAAVAAHFGMERAIVVGWSVGVAVACSLAVTKPDLVAGIVAVCGVPQSQSGLRGAVDAMTQPALSVGLQAARSLPGPVLDLLSGVPANSSTVALLRAGGLIGGGVDQARTVAVLRAYLDHDPAWYLQLARQAMRSSGPPLSDVGCPVVFLAGRQDPFVSWQSVAATARDAGSAATIVAGTHFLPLERPDLIEQRIRVIAARTGLS